MSNGLKNHTVVEAAAADDVPIPWAFRDDNAGLVARLRAVMTRCLHLDERQRPRDIVSELGAATLIPVASVPFAKADAERGAVEVKAIAPLCA